MHLMIKWWQTLKKPLGRLYFVGDAYHSAHDGYAHEAYLSAEEQAKNILNCMRRNCKNK